MQRHILLLTPYLKGYSDRTGNITCLLRNISCLWIGHIWSIMKINVKDRLSVSTQFIKCRVNRCRNLGYKHSLIARFMGPTWGPSGADRTHGGPMLAPWTLLSGMFHTISRLATQIREKFRVCPLPSHCSWHQSAQFTYANCKTLFDNHQAFHCCLLLIHWAPLVINFDVQFNVTKISGSNRSPLLLHLWDWI